MYYITCVTILRLEENMFYASFIFVIGAQEPPDEFKHEQKWNRSEESNNIVPT